jgi:hypothetical protein
MEAMAMAMLLNSPILLNPLCLGNNGEAVRALQTQLNEARSGLPLNVDGRFGISTHRALLAFQRQKGLKPDGVVGPKCAEVLGWQYRAGSSRPYVVRYDKPPLPPLTPPLAVIAAAVWSGLEPFKLLMVDDIAHAYDHYSNPNATSDVYSAQGKQKFQRYEELNWHFIRVRNRLDQLENFTNGQDDSVLSDLRDTFAYFKMDMSTGYRAMEFYGGNMNLPVRNLESLPFQQILGAIERVMKGEQLMDIAITGMRMSLDAAKQTWVKSW